MKALDAAKVFGEQTPEVFLDGAMEKQADVQEFAAMLELSLCL